MLFIVSCSNRKHTSDNYPKDAHVYQVQKENVKPDTFKKVSPANMGSSVNSSTVSHKEKEPDNLRGFDPASEDDMEDNGMSRYMENNDEEGWD